MYRKYAAEALVLGWRSEGEANKMYALMTKEFGLVWVRALAVRTEKSKMRYALQTGGHARVSLIRGKRGWRAGGAVPENDLLEGDAARAFARAASLALRLIHGEERNEYLFETLRAARTTLLAASREAVPGIELLVVARMLHALGYLPGWSENNQALFEEEVSVGLGEHASTVREELIRSINTALASTHL